MNMLSFCKIQIHKMFMRLWYAVSSVWSTHCSFCTLWEGTWHMAQKIPDDQHITYQLQYRKCGKPSCKTCRDGLGHGPYWYAYWRQGSRLKSGYVGKNKVEPETEDCNTSTLPS